MGGRAHWGKNIFPVPSLLATVALLELAKKFVELVLIIGVRVLEARCFAWFEGRMLVCWSGDLLLGR